MPRKFPWQKGDKSMNWMTLYSQHEVNKDRGLAPIAKPPTKREFSAETNPSFTKRPKKPNTKYDPTPYDISPDYFQVQRPPSLTGRRGKGKA